jgi:hypothetical protein
MWDVDYVTEMVDRAMSGFNRSDVARKVGEMQARFRGFLDRVAGLLE